MWRGKVCMQMICMISMCDLLASVFVAFGFPTNDTWCSFQGASVFFFSRASWFWSILCLFTLYKIVIYGQVPLSIRTMHYIVWPLSVVLELLPLTTSTWYGTASFLLGKGLCNFDTQSSYYYVWAGMLYILPLTVSTVLLLFLSAKLWLRIRPMTAGYQRALVRSVVLYPCVTLLTCIPLLVLFIWDWHLSNARKPSSEAAAADKFLVTYSFVGYTFAWNALQGFINTVVFFVNSGESRERWHKLLAECWKGCRIACCADAAEAERLRTEDKALDTLMNPMDFLDDGEMEQAIRDQMRDFHGDGSSRASTDTDCDASRSSGRLGLSFGGRLDSVGRPSAGTQTPRSAGRYVG